MRCAQRRPLILRIVAKLFRQSCERLRGVLGCEPETLGHAAVAVKRDHDWLLYAADAYFYVREMDAAQPYCTPGLRLYQWMLEKDRRARLANRQRLRELRRQHTGDVDVFWLMRDFRVNMWALRHAHRAAGQSAFTSSTLACDAMGGFSFVRTSSGFVGVYMKTDAGIVFATPAP